MHPRPSAPASPKSAPRWLWISGAVAAVCMVAGGVLLSQIPSDEELAQRAATELTKGLGVPVSVGSLHWHFRPGLVIEIHNMATAQEVPVVIRHASAQLSLAALWQRRVKVDRMTVDGAVLPQLSLRQLKAKPPEPGSDEAQGNDGAKTLQLDALPLSELVFTDVTWVSRYGNRVVYAGEVNFDTAWRPRTVQIRRPGIAPAADLALTRQGQEDRWDVLVHLGGGTGTGELALTQPKEGKLQLKGQLRDRDVDLVSALAAFNRRSVVDGTAQGDTTLYAEGDNVAALGRSLHTTTAFHVNKPTVLRFDLEKAIRTLGKDHAGSTPLQSLTGQLDSQNTPKGMVLNFTQVKATSGALTASGEARIAERQIQGELSVDLVDGVVGVPLKVSGPLSHIDVSVAPGAIAGAVVGTAVLPGVGTVLGAKVGEALGKIFKPAKPQSPTRRSPAPVIRH